ncbi:uncharacterized protein N7503_001413 [Penicillium pulvis]|uniref:uncharacterized protein n=1 Tax=Penicillium pulvis TaxID=1562058 RepID=UPI0025475FC8|nr:uncharacterized protein N7503_001413 [Penicillium pulvis]KAJ5809195.1 hypothetical protein N7503_001413 [Penicillium pulvis]
MDKTGTIVAHAPHNRRDSTLSTTKIATKIAKKDFIKKWLHTTPRKTISVPANPEFTLEKPDFTPGDFMKHICVDFTAMIQEAIKNSPSNKQSTRGICKEIMRTNAWYRTHQNSGWQEIVAEELAKNPIFRPLIECHNGKISRTRSVKWLLSFAAPTSTAHASTAESTSSDTNTESGWNVPELSDTSTAVDSSTESAHGPPQRSSTEVSCTSTSTDISSISTGNSMSRSTEYEIQFPPEDLAELPASCMDAELPESCVAKPKCGSWENTYSVSPITTFETHEGERYTERPFSMSELTLVSPISPQSPNRFSPTSFAAFSLHLPNESSYYDNHTSTPPPKYVDIPRKRDESFHMELEPDPTHIGGRMSFDMSSIAPQSPRRMTASPISSITQVQENSNSRLAETRVSSSALSSTTSEWPIHSPKPGPASNNCSLKRGNYVRKSKKPVNMQQREEIGRWIEEIPSQTQPTPPDTSGSHLIRYQLYDTPMEDEEMDNNDSSAANNGGRIPSGFGDTNDSGEKSPPKKGGRPPPQDNRGTGRDDDGNQDRKRKRLHSPDRDERRRFACVYHKFDPNTYGVNNRKYLVCAGAGFKFTSELVRHLARNHDEFICGNCLEQFADDEQRHNHYEHCTVRLRCSQEERWQILYRARFPGAPVPEDPYQSTRLRTPPPRINTSLGPAPTNTEPSSNASGLAPSLPSTSSSETSPKLMECMVRIEGLEKRLPDFEDRIIRLVMKLDPTSSNPVSRTHSHISQKCPTVSPSLKSAADEPFFSSQGGTDTTTSSSKPSPSSDVPFNWSAFQPSTGDILIQPSQTTDVNMDDSGLWREFPDGTNASVTALNHFSSVWSSSDGERNSFGKEMGQQSDPPPTNLADFAWGDVMFPAHDFGS